MLNAGLLRRSIGDGNTVEGHLFDETSNASRIGGTDHGGLEMTRKDLGVDTVEGIGVEILGLGIGDFVDVDREATSILENLVGERDGNLFNVVERSCQLARRSHLGRGSDYSRPNNLWEVDNIK